MRFLYLVLILTLCTCARAQHEPPPDYTDSPPGDPVGHDGIAGSNDHTCQVIGEVKAYTVAELTAAKNNTDTLLPVIYEVLDYDYVSFFSSPAAAEANYRDAFEQVRKIYERDATISPQLELYLHTEPSGYVADNSFAALFEFKDAVPNFPGNFAGLRSFRGSGGIAFVSAACGANAYNYCSVEPFHAPLTVYSWTVKVISHELGHNFGSDHTHACKWNGNNTALEGSYPPEGDCERPPVPARGNIMSYDQLNANVINDLRILPEVANVERAHLMAAGCIARKPAVDVPQPCIDYPVTIEIITDLHPRETAWSIVDENDITVASGGPYTKDQYLSAIADSLCIPEGCYTLRVTDTAGDGMDSDDYGFGSYHLRIEGEELATGAVFTDVDVREFCVGTIPATCDPIALTGFEPYGGNQDYGTGELSFNDTRLTITGNGWKSKYFPYTLTESSIMELQMKAPNPGEIIAVGLDDNHVLSSNRSFRLGGSQSWGLGGYDLYPQEGGGWMRVSLPIGQFYTGDAERIFFINDKDWGPPDNVATFRDVILHEGQCGAASFPGAFAGAGEVKESEVSFTADIATDWLLSDMSGRVLLRGYAGPGATVRFEEANVPIGVYTLSWMSDEGPMAEKKFISPRLH